MTRTMTQILMGTLLALGLTACAEQTATGPVGVNTESKTIYIGALNDESGPAAGIGKPYAIGKRILAAEINAGSSGLLPEGWKIELIERDHGYNPQRSVQAFNEIKDQVLTIGTSFGTPNTLPLIPMLERENIVAFPASLSSKMAENQYTPPLTASYELEAMRAMDWVVANADDVKNIRAAIIYQQDDYGKDGLTGWKKAAAHYGVKIVAEETYAPGQTDYTAPVSALKNKGATHVLLTTLPSATAPIMGAGFQLQYEPVWIGNSPAWIDRFFNASVVPAKLFKNFYWVTSQRYWGENIPMMTKFIEQYNKHGKTMASRDFYMISGYMQGRVIVEAAKRALQKGELNRQSFLLALRTLRGYDIDGALPEPLNFANVPYQVGKQTRVLSPNLPAKKWQVVADFATPKAL